MICSMVMWDCWLRHWTHEILYAVNFVHLGPIGWLAFYVDRKAEGRKP